MNVVHIVWKKFKQKRESGGQELMLEFRLETEMDTNFIYFEQQNYRKQKDILVCSFILCQGVVAQLIGINCLFS